MQNRLFLIAIVLASVLLGSCSPYRMKAKMASQDGRYDLALDYALKHYERNQGSQSALHFLEKIAQKYQDQARAEISWLQKNDDWSQMTEFSRRTEERLAGLLRVRGISTPSREDIKYFQQMAESSNLKQTEELYNQGLAKYNAGEFEAALALFRTSANLIKNYKNSADLIRLSQEQLAEANYAKGIAAFNAGNYSQALEQFEQCLGHTENYKDAGSYVQKSKENLALAAYQQAQILARQGNYEAALTEYEKTQGFVPNFMDVGMQLEKTRRQYAQKQYEQAQSALTSGQYRQALANLDKVLQIQNDYPGAREKYDETKAMLTLRLAVLPFQAVGLTQSFANAISEKIIAKALPQKSEFLVFVDRENLEKVLQEQALGQTGAIDEKTAVQVGKITGVNVMMTGKISLLGVNEPRTTQSTRTGSYQQSYRDPRGVQRKTSKSFNYTVHERSRSVNLQISYSLIDVETGQIIDTKSFTKLQTDKAEWISCPPDRINDLPGGDKNKLSASQQPRLADALISDAMEDLSQQAVASFMAKVKAMQK